MRGVYAIVNALDGKCYIGSAVNVRRRWSAHRRELRRGSHSNRYLQSAWAKYGERAFVFVVVEPLADAQSLVEREQAWLDVVCSFERHRGYNLSPSAYSLLGFRFTPEQRENVARGLRGRAKSPEHRAATAASAKARVTDETRSRMAEVGRSGRGLPKTPDHRERIGAAQRGSANHAAKLDEEAIAEIRRRLSAGEQGRSLAAEFGVSEPHISCIKNGRRWRHVSDPIT